MLNISNISKSYGDQTLFTGVYADIGDRDRIALIGPNGSGKTTLFDIMAGNISPDSGHVTRQKEATIGFLRQEISPSSERQLLEDVMNASSLVSDISHRIATIQDSLKKDMDASHQKKLLRELGELQHKYEAAGGYDIEHEVKTILSGLGFAQSDFQRPLTEFSGGWLMRVELAKLLLIKPDLLLLDEPTNHLDIRSKDILMDALSAYDGTLVFVSHDRYFLNGLATKVLEIGNQTAIAYPGNYEDYIYKKELDNLKETGPEELSQPDARQTVDKSAKTRLETRKKKVNPYKIQQVKKRIEQLEEKIQLNETRISVLTQMLASEKLYRDHQLFRSTMDEHDELQNELNGFMNQWEELQSELELLEGKE